MNIVDNIGLILIIKEKKYEIIKKNQCKNNDNTGKRMFSGVQYIFLF